MDNTDDHAKNHAFLRLPSGHFELAPAYDLLPQMSGLGKQAIPVSLRSAEDDFASAMACSADFGLSEEEAVDSWRDVARGVAEWKEVFTGLGVSSRDIAYLSDFIDSDDKRFLRSERVADTL
jgi:serine/threonine-protein kinase HipA